MALLLTLFALITAAVLVVLAYAARLVYVYVGPDILQMSWRLFRQGALSAFLRQVACANLGDRQVLKLAGSLRFSKLVLRPALSVRGFAVVEPKAADGEQLFSAELCTMQSPLKGLLSGMQCIIMHQPLHGT